MARRLLGRLYACEANSNVAAWWKISLVIVKLTRVIELTVMAALFYFCVLGFYFLGLATHYTVGLDHLIFILD